MPVVRELVNRLSFKINPGDLKNAQKAMKGMEKGGLSVVNVVKGIGKAFNLAAKSVGLLSAAGTKMFTEFEQNTGASNFFSRSAEDAQKLLDSLDEIAAKSETTSRREARQASKILSQLTADVEKFIPFIEKISIARPDLDFNQVAETLSAVIKGGDLQALIDLVPGIKDDLEVLSKTTFGKPFGDIFEAQRADLVLQKLIQSRTRIDELAAEQQKTLNIEFVKLAKEASDFALKFGETIAPDIKSAVESIRVMIKELNDSEGFWKTVKDTVDGIKGVIEFFTTEDRAKLIRQEDEKRQEDLRKRQESARAGTGNILDLPLAEAISTFLDKTGISSQFGIQSGVRAAQREFGPQVTSLDIGGEITVKGEGLQGVDTADLSSKITRSIIGQIEDGFKAVTVQNGGFATPGGF